MYYRYRYYIREHARSSSAADRNRGHNGRMGYSDRNFCHPCPSQLFYCRREYILCRRGVVSYIIVGVISPANISFSNFEILQENIPLSISNISIFLFALHPSLFSSVAPLLEGQDYQS